MSTRLSKRTLIPAVLAVGAMLSLSACGETPGCRAATGAGVGALGGLAAGSLVGAPVAGAAVGAVGGAAVGASTSPSAVNGPSPCY
ncbi:MAG TPA: hypothetical protein VGG27_10925 [Magnetospirillaceae bacterium]|jgi:hypothetical protein